MNKDERDIRDALDPSLLSKVFFVGAPPRSGNTYLRYVLQDAYGNTEDLGEVFKHDHSSSYPLEHLVDRNNIFPIFVSPIRDPYATLKSKLVRTFGEWDSPPGVIEYATSVDDLCLYWEILLLDPNRFCLVDFNELTADKDSIIAKIDSRYPETAPYRNLDLSTNEEILDFMRLEDDGKYGGNEKLFLSYGHTPRPKSEYSDMAEDLLSTPVYTRRLEYLYKMYKELLEKTI